MSLNHRRRIFRREAAATPSLGRVLPPPGVVLAGLGGLAGIVVAAALFIRPSHAPALAPTIQQLSAPADKLAVIDGDTLRIGDHVVRLEGIAAPPRGSLCRGAAQGSLDCGVAAANSLASLVKAGPVACTIHGADAMGRPLADCLSAGVPLSQTLVRDGWARAQRADLRSTEDAARADGVGIWRPLGGS